MIRITTSDAEQVMSAVRSIPRGGTTYTTNFFVSLDELRSWERSGPLSILVGKTAALVLRKDCDFLRIYHAASDPEALSAALANLDTGAMKNPLVADLVGRVGSLRPTEAAYEGNGFIRYAQLRRMSLFPRAFSSYHLARGVMVARVDDAPDVYNLLRRQLDPLVEQIPDQARVCALIEKNQLLIARKGSLLAGVLAYESFGLTVILRYWHVNQDLRHQGIGSRLMHSFFHLCSRSKRVLLWVIDHNRDAIDRYIHYGFEHEALVDDIMLRKTSARDARDE